MRPPLWLVVALCLAVPTALRTQAWKNDLSLWRAEVSANPDSLRGWTNVANAAYFVGQFGLAETAIQHSMALSINQPYHPWMRECAWVMSMTTASKMYLLQGNVIVANRLMDEVIKRDPDFPPAIYQIGILTAIKEKRCEAGMVFWKRASQMDPFISVPTCE